MRPLGFLVCDVVLSASCHGGTRFRATSGGVLDLLVGEENDDGGNDERR